MDGHNAGVMDNRAPVSMFYDAQTDAYTDVCPYREDGAGIKRQISEILKSRGEHCGALEQAENTLRDISNAVTGFLSVKGSMFPDKASVERIFEGGQPGEADAFWQNLSAMDSRLAESIGSRCLTIASMIENTKARFERKNICVAVVGNNGEGKSTLIQNITGLDEDTIPTSSGGICTAARSMIKNDEEFLAKIYFYTMQELLDDVLAPYLRHFGVLKEDASLRSIIDAQQLFRQIPVGSGDQYYKRLKLYITELEKYQSFIGRSRQSLTDKQDVRKFISQRDKDGSELNSYAYLAVKFVEIECPFPSIDVHNLILIDTIGVNEPTLNIKQQMFNTIKDTADFVMYVKKIVADRSQWIENTDMTLYFEILNNLPNIPANKWVYCVFNYMQEFDEGGALKKSSFFDNYDIMLKLIPEQEAAKKPGAFINVNCADKQAVKDKLISPMLKHLAANLKDIDAALIEAVNDNMAALSADFESFASDVNALTLRKRDDTSIRLLLTHDLIQKLISRLTESARQLVKTLRESNTTDNWRLSVSKLTADIEDFIPDKEYVNDLYQRSGSALRTIEDVYSVTRARLHAMFDRDEFTFDELAQTAKRECAKLFMQAGGLEAVEELRVDYDDKHVMFEIAEKLFTHPTADGLKREFRTIDNLTIDHGRTLSQFMKEIVTCIDPNRGDGNIPAYWEDTGLAEAIIEKLRSKMDGIREAIADRMTRMDSPEQMVSNVISAFVTTITQMGNFQMPWMVTLQPYIMRIEPGAFEDMELFNGNVGFWNSIVEGLKRMNALGKINF